MPVLQYVQQLYSSSATPAIVESALRSAAVIADPLANVKLRLNSLGVAGFFGGDIAINGMATAIFFRRGLGGLYNTPGSLEIARRYGQLATKRIYRGLFPGDIRDPSRLFGLDGKPGPKFLAAQSGSLFEKTGHIGYLVARLARRERPEASVRELAERHPQRITTPATVTVIDLNHLDKAPPDMTITPELPYPNYGLFSLIPAGVSVLACIACVLVGDWWTFGSIMWGMFANWFACFILGQGEVTFQHPEPAPDAPRGDGILWAADNAVVVILGSERAVNTITRGRFFLKYNSCRRDSVGTGGGARPEPDSAPEGGAPNTFLIGISGILLIIQFFAQLLLIPQVELFGQVMFLLTVAASWGYNVLISSIDREDIQLQILRGDEILSKRPKKPKDGANVTTALPRSAESRGGMFPGQGDNGIGGQEDEGSVPGRGEEGPAPREDEDPSPTQEGEDPVPRQGVEERVLGRPEYLRVRKFEFGTWTAMATFACLALRESTTPLKSYSKMLDALIPNDTDVWVEWKALVNNQLDSKQPDAAKLTDQKPGAPKMLGPIIGDASVAIQRYLEAFPAQGASSTGGEPENRMKGSFANTGTGCSRQSKGYVLSTGGSISISKPGPSRLSAV